MIKPKSIVCSHKNYEDLKKRYTKREIIPDIHCRNDSFIVYKQQGTYVVYMNDWKVYVYKYVLARR